MSGAGPVSKCQRITQACSTQLFSARWCALVPIASQPVFLLLGIAGVSYIGRRSGDRRRPGVVRGSRGCIAGLAIAPGPLCHFAVCRGRPRHSPVSRNCRGQATRWGCKTRRDGARSHIFSSMRVGAAETQCRDSDQCRVVFPAYSRRIPAMPFTMGAGRCCFVRRRRASFHSPHRGAGDRDTTARPKLGLAPRSTGIAHFAPPHLAYGVRIPGPWLTSMPRASRRRPSGAFAADHLLDEVA